MGGTIGIEIERLQTSKSQSQTHTGLVGRHTVQQSDLDEWVTGGLAKGSCKPDFGSWYGLDHPQKRLTPIPVAFAGSTRSSSGRLLGVWKGTK